MEAKVFSRAVFKAFSAVLLTSVLVSSGASGAAAGAGGSAGRSERRLPSPLGGIRAAKSTSGLQPQQSVRIYENDYDGYAITYPASWNIRAAGGGGSGTDISPSPLAELTPQSTRLNIVTFRNPRGLSVLNWHAAAISDARPIATESSAGLALFHFIEPIYEFIEFGALQDMQTVYFGANDRIYRVIKFCVNEDCAQLSDIVRSIRIATASTRADALPLPAPIEPMSALDGVSALGQHIDQAPSFGLEAPWQNGDVFVLSGNYYGEGAHNDVNNDWYATDWNKKGTSCDGDKGQPVLAAGTGTAVLARNTDPGLNSGGKVVRIQSNRDSSVTFAIYHLDSVSVSQGEYISSMPRQIGTVGKTGLDPASCAHIHLSVRQTVSGIVYSIRPGNLSGQSVFKGAEITSHNGSTPPPSCDATSVPGGYYECAVEGGTCTFSGTQSIYYGAPSCYRVRTYTNSVACNNDNFAPDPKYGVQKHCYAPSTPSCSPNADQAALFEHANYSGACVVKGIGDYPNPVAMGIPNDSLSSVKVGGNVKLYVCGNDNYGPTCETFTGDDPNLDDNAIGNDLASSAKVQARTDCNSVSFNGVILYADKTCNGTTRQFSSPTGWINVPSDYNDMTSSVYVGSGWSVKVYEHDVAAGGGSWRCLVHSMWDLSVDYYDHGNSSLRINDTISSVNVFHNSTCTASSTANYRSAGPYDGWVLESGENTNLGGSLNAGATTFALGDNSLNRQYRSVLSFNTSGLPDNAVITAAILKIRRAAVTGSNPFGSLGNIWGDIRKGAFNSNPALQLADFQVAASRANAFAIVNNPTIAGWYIKGLPSTSFGYINKTGTTQFRLRFAIDDNNNAVANYITFYSGNAAGENQPLLVITYYVP